jgi:hypothetical protein
MNWTEALCTSQVPAYLVETNGNGTIFGSLASVPHEVATLQALIALQGLRRALTSMLGTKQMRSVGVGAG